MTNAANDQANDQTNIISHHYTLNVVQGLTINRIEVTRFEVTDTQPEAISMGQNKFSSIINNVVDETRCNATNGQSDETDPVISKTNARKRNRSNKNSEKANARKKARLLGQAYTGITKDSTLKKMYVERKSKSILARCHHEEENLFQCASVSDDTRAKTFEEFWKLESWIAKRSFVRGSVATKLPVGARPAKQLKFKGNKPKEFIRNCFLPDKTGKKVLVCKQFFLATLCIGRSQFSSWTGGKRICMKKEQKLFVTREKQQKTGWIYYQKYLAIIVAQTPLVLTLRLHFSQKAECMLPIMIMLRNITLK